MSAVKPLAKRYGPRAVTTLAMVTALMVPMQAQAPQTPPQGRGAAAPTQPAPAAQRGRGPGASPASQRPPQSTTAQTYSAEQITAGRTLFAAQCGFCHGRDAAGGESGPDLTRSPLVAQDVRGDRITSVVTSGRPDKGMPPFTLRDADIAGLVAFIHDQQTHASTQLGGRRSVDPADLQTGNAAAGKTYFDNACTKCHAATGDLKGVASRLQGLPLLQRMLYPGSTGPVERPAVVVTERSGRTVSGKLAYRDEFTIALTDAGGWNRSWPVNQVSFTVDDKLQGHVEQLGKYSDTDMHNVLAYLQTLK